MVDALDDLDAGFRSLIRGLALPVLAGGWLRGYTKNGVHITWTVGHKNEMFIRLAAELTVVLGVLDKLLDQRTDTTQPILPKPVDEGRRLGRPAYEVRPKSKRIGGLLLPPKYRTA